MNPQQKPLKDLLHDLSDDSVRLLRQETALFKTEMKMRIEKVERQAMVLGAGGLVAYTGALVLAFALVFLLAEAMPIWLAAAIVGGALAVTGAILVARGKDKLSGESMAPRDSIESVRRDIRTVREATT